jgi:hypothetical protein
MDPASFPEQFLLKRARGQPSIYTFRNPCHNEYVLSKTFIITVNHKILRFSVYLEIVPHKHQLDVEKKRAVTIRG